MPSLHRAYPRCPPRSPNARYGRGLTKWGVSQKYLLENREYDSCNPLFDVFVVTEREKTDKRRLSEFMDCDVFD